MLPRRIQFPVLALLLALATPTAAPAAPAGFHGVNFDREVTRGATWTSRIAPQFDAMRGVGVDTVRTVFRWSEIQHAEEAAPYFGETDVLVTEAVKNRMSLLPIVLGVPGWAAKYPGRPGSPPRTDEAARFLAKLIGRYGHDGSFWVEHPELEKRPVRYWQMWNEPEIDAYWNEPKPWIGYAKLVRASYSALRSADPQARLVLAGSVGFSWESLERLYRQGIKGHFDVVAIHPYTGSVDEVAEIVRRNRKVMRLRGDARRPLWITELSWPASKGRMKPPSGLRRVVTDDRGMARRLTRAYAYFERPKKRAHRVGRIYWYTWASRYGGRDDVFDYAGLLRFRDGEFVRMPAWTAFRRSARD